MAIQKPTITHGILHNEAYWKVVQVNLNVIIKTEYITFNCYHSVIEKDINENVLTQKSYSVNSKEYDLYFNTKIFLALVFHVLNAISVAMSFPFFSTFSL